MKTGKDSTPPAVRNKYTAQFKGQSLESAERGGVSKVRLDLCLVDDVVFFIVLNGVF
jgi:hypothetical protein